jgi:hypothetical protein
MKPFFLFFYLLPVFCLSQSLVKSDDIFVLKRHGANLRTYTTGLSFTMETIYDQWFDGTITAIRNDSVFLNGLPFDIKEISAIRRERTKLNYAVDGTILMAAGGGLLLLGAVNGILRGDDFSQWYTPANLIVSGALLVSGFLLRSAHFKKYILGKKYTLEYLELNPNKK